MSLSDIIRLFFKPRDNSLELSLDIIAKWEGFRSKAYQDIGGVWTIGYGFTKGVRPGDTMTKEAGYKRLREEVGHFRKGVVSSLPKGSSPEVKAACTSLAYNIGLSAFRKSTCLKRLHTKDIQGAAEALQWFNKVNGEFVQGLANRRAEEAKLMLSSLKGRTVCNE